MSVHSVVSRLHDAGFAVVPVLNMHGGDTGVLAWRRDPVDLIVITAWSDDYAVGARVSRGRDWSRPFAATGGARFGPASFAEIVDELLRGRHRLSDDLSASDGAASVGLVEGAR